VRRCKFTSHAMAAQHPHVRQDFGTDKQRSPNFQDVNTNSSASTSTHRCKLPSSTRFSHCWTAPFPTFAASPTMPIYPLLKHHLIVNTYTHLLRPTCIQRVSASHHPPIISCLLRATLSRGFNAVSQWSSGISLLSLLPCVESAH
jgi:hypothetical protein